MLGITILLESAFSKFSSVKCSGHTVPYQRRLKAVKISAICGSAASSVTSANTPVGRNRRQPAGGRAALPAFPLTVELAALRPSTNFPARYITAAKNSITTTSAYGTGLVSSSMIPLKICTAVTRLKPNISGVPSSVKLHTSTMLPPAKMPGFISGSVIRRKRVHHDAPRLRAASLSCGSRLPSAVTRFKYRIGYRCSASMKQTDQNRPRPPRKSTGSKPQEASSVLTTP